MLDSALALAASGLPVFALNGKTPYANCPECHRKAGCKCAHLFCHAFHAATTDLARVTAMWEMRPRSNIGVRPPPGFFVVDIDPRNGGVEPADLPPTWKAWSGRGDGGYHLWFRGDRPKGKLGPGVDVKDWTGYVVAPPSLHPDTGLPYHWDQEPAELSEWPVRIQGRPTTTRRDDQWVGRLASVPGTWEQVLEPEGWTTNGRGDWQHPQASTTLSARVVDDLLYVFSTSTDFEATESGTPRGYNRVQAYALLNGLDLDTFEGWITTIKALES